MSKKSKFTASTWRLSVIAFAGIVVLTAFLGIRYSASAISEAPQYTQGFEVDGEWGAPSAPAGTTTVSRVASGTNGITSRTGGFHGEVVAGQFTRWGGYSSVFPPLGFTTSVDVYLNVGGAFTNDTRFDFTSAASNSSGGHRRDFAFNAGFYNDAGGPGSGMNRFVVSASNSTGRANSFPKNAGRNPIAVTTTGWYKFKHRFYNNGGVLAVEMSVINSSNITMGTWTLSDPSDLIPSVVGGNRYGWFANNEFSFLAIDNSVRANIVPPTVTKVSNLNPQGWGFFNEGATGSGSFVTGPATPPLGTGSVNLTVDATGRHNIGKLQTGLRFDRITELGYSSYQTSANAASTISLQLQVDYDLTDANPAFQGRLIYEPYHTETVLQNTWQTWTPLTGKWWASGAPGNGVCPQSAPCTWPQVLAAFPNGGTHGSPSLGAIIFRAGGPVGSPFTGNVDNFTLGIDNVDNVTDFELANHLVVDDDGLGSSTSCDDTDAVSLSIADSVAAASPGDTIKVCPGTYPQSSTLALNKANLTIDGVGPGKPLVQVASAIGDGINVSASGVTINNLEIQKTDLANQTVVHVGGNNFTATNNLIYGPNPGMTWNAAGIVSRAFVVQSLSGTNISNNTIHTLRQPAYMSGQNNVAAGTISNNNVSGTKGWVVEGGNYTFTGNTWGEPQNQDCDIALLNTIWLHPPFYQPLLTLSSGNDNAFICAQYAGGENGRAVAYVDDGAGAGGNGSDNTNYNSINAGIAGALTGGTVQVAGGTYNEDVIITKTLKVLGAGPTSTTVIGPIGGSGADTFRINASNAELAGFTITRAGNNATDWENPGLNGTGIAIQGQALTGNLIHDNLITGMRTAIDINHSNGHTMRNNVIDFNRTGLIFRNQTDNITFVENQVTNNHTVGILFLDASGGSNSPIQTAANCTFFNNNISGNWFGEIVDRQSGGSLPAPGTSNLKNFSGNWYGSTAPVVSTANSAEAGYSAATCPAPYPGCTATNPGGQPDILGPASANFDYSPFMNDGTDTNVETVLGRGTYGFQGSFNSLSLSATSAQVGATSKIQEGIDLVNAGGTLNIPNGTYAGNVNVNKALTIQGTFTVGGSFTTSAAGVIVKPGTSPGIISTGNLSFGTGTDVDMELNGVVPGLNHDQFDVTGTVSIASGVDLNLSIGYVPGTGHSYTIIDNDGVDAVTGTFNGLADDQVFFVGPYSFSINYNGGDGNDVVITAVANCNAVTIPTNITSLTGVNVNVPVNVDDTTGNGLMSTDFTLTYNNAVITTPVVSLGTVTAGSTLTVNHVSPGTMVVSIFQATPWTGAGTLANIQFSVVGLPGTSSPVAFSAFKFNEGTPCSSTSNGLVTVISGTITGTVTYGNVVDLPAAPRFIPSVTLNAVGSVNVSTSTAPPTMSNGQYTLSGMGAGPYTVTPSKVGGVTNFAGGGQTITSFDSAMIARHVVGFTGPTPILPFTGAQIAAADVSGTGGVTSFDAALIARWVAGLPGYGNTANWVFTPTNRSYANVNTNQTGQDYTAILMGDATGNYHQGLSPARPAPLSDKEAIVTSVPKMTAQSGDIVTVPVTISDTTDRWVNSYQFELTYDADLLEPAAQAVEVAGTLSESYVATVNPIEPGRLVVVMFGVNPLSGAGNLINLRFNVIGRSGVAEIGWNNMLLNEGNPRAAVVAGQIRVMPNADDEDQPGLGGRVLTANGQAISGAVVTVTDTTGKVRSVVSNVDGVYSVRGVEPGQAYTITVEARQHAFTPITVSAGNRLTITDLIAN